MMNTSRWNAPGWLAAVKRLLARKQPWLLALLGLLLLGLAIAPARGRAADEGPYPVTVALTAIEPNPVLMGETVVITVTVSTASPLHGIPTGEVELRSGDELLCLLVLDANGVATCDLSFPQPAMIPLVAVYGGESPFLPGVSGAHYLQVRSTEQSTLVYSHDFETPVGSEWCFTGRTTSPQGARTFLGPLRNQTACLALDGLGEHQSVSLAFDLYLASSWNGNQEMMSLKLVGPDRWMLHADGLTLLDTTFANWPDQYQSYPAAYLQANYPAHTGAVAVGSLGYTGEEVPPDSIYHLVYTIPHFSSSLALDFSAQIKMRFPDEEMWGLDNIIVWINDSQAQLRIYLPVVAK